MDRSAGRSSEPAKMLRVGVSDPLPIFAEGICAAVRSESLITVPVKGCPVDWVRSVSSSGASAAIVLSLVTEQLRHALAAIRTLAIDVPIVALLPSSMCSAPHMRKAIAEGATTALPRDSEPATVYRSIMAATEGETVLAPGVMADLLAPVDNFSEEEIVWLQALAGGKSVEEVAWLTGYSRRTMYRRLRPLYRKLGAEGHVQAILAAKDRGLL